MASAMAMCRYGPGIAGVHGEFVAESAQEDAAWDRPAPDTSIGLPADHGTVEGTDNYSYTGS